MTRRYYAPKLPQAGGLVLLDGAESHHAFSVMRVREGDQIELFDGIGCQANAIVQSADRRTVTCLSEPAARLDRESRIRLELGIAMPKGDRAKELVERLTELGVYRIVPIHCERTPWAVSENALLKWQREVIDACKQCGRNHLMQIDSPEPYANWLQRCDGQALRLIAHPQIDAVAELDASAGHQAFENTDQREDAHQTVRIGIGPEGGFSETEVQQAEQAGWRCWSLGSRILRIETAAVAAAVHYCLEAPFSRTRYISRHGN